MVFPNAVAVAAVEEVEVVVVEADEGDQAPPHHQVPTKTLLPLQLLLLVHTQRKEARKPPDENLGPPKPTKSAWSGKKRRERIWLPWLRNRWGIPMLGRLVLIVLWERCSRFQLDP